MAYFAIISDKPSSFKVVRCHINVWALNELFGMTFFFDVGIGLRSIGSEPVTKFQVALPFRSSEFEDLRDKLLNTKTARLILGQPVEIKDGVISFDETNERNSKKTIKLKTMSVPKPELDKMSTNNYSLWNFELKSPIEPEGSTAETYIRMRFPVQSFSRTWVKQGSGALVDIRISDVREGLAAQWEALEPNIVEIDGLNLFIIAPSTMKSRSVSPELKYVRLLEGPLWENYLGRRLQLVGRNKQIIYYWRSEKPINRNKPFMAFLDLAKEHTTGYSRFLLLNMLVLVTLWGIYRFFPANFATKDAWEYVRNLVLTIGVIAVAKGLWSGGKLFIEKIIPRVIELPRWLNDLVYSTKKKPPG